MEVKRSAVYGRVAETWFYTMVGLLALFFLTFVAALFAMRRAGPRLVLILVPIWLVLMCFAGVGSVRRIVKEYSMKKADRCAYPLLYECVEEICAQWPRFRMGTLYVWPDSSANACAFGIGVFGYWGIAVTQSLYDKMTKQELKGVLAHEIAHVRCRDVGLFTALVAMTGIIRLWGWRIWIRRPQLALIIPMLLASAFFFLLSWILFPLGIKAISQEREKSADALASLYCGTTEGLKSALSKLHSLGERKREPSAFESLLMSHPWYKIRLQALEKLEAA